MRTTVVSTRGQVVIPFKTRQRFNIKKGTRICLTEVDDKIILTPLTPAYFERIAGFLNTKGKLTKSLLKERAKEKHLERI